MRGTQCFTQQSALLSSGSLFSSKIKVLVWNLLLLVLCARNEPSFNQWPFTKIAIDKNEAFASKYQVTKLNERV